MSKYNFYAIEAGGEKQIFETWGECQAFRNKNPRGAQYQGFKTRREAERYLGLQSSAYVYAVKAGHKPGIYATWDECKEQTATFADPVYRKFPNREMAKRWLSDGEKKREKAIAYTDGSFNENLYIHGYGVILFNADDENDRFEYSGHGSNWAESRNVTGEIYGAVRAVREAITLGYKAVEIFHDYEGIEAWITGRWGTSKALTRWYKQTMDDLQKEIDITFHHVKGHSGDRLNALVDGIAKEAVHL